MFIVDLSDAVERQREAIHGQPRPGPVDSQTEERVVKTGNDSQREDNEGREVYHNVALEVENDIG